MLALPLTLAAAWLLAQSAVDVRSSTDCPSSQDITQRLNPLLPRRGSTATAPDIVVLDPISVGRSRLHLRLIRANGAEVGNRLLAPEGDCAEIASAVAAVIAAWETEPLLSMPPSPPPAELPASARTAPSPDSPSRLALGVGGGLALVRGAAGVGRMELVLGKRSSWVQGRLGVAYETARTASLSIGEVDWRHLPAEMTLLVRTVHPVWSVSVDAGPTAGLFSLQAHGFSPNRPQSVFEFGGVAGARLSRTWGRWDVWAEVRLYGWVQTQSAKVTGADASVDLPNIDVMANLGVLVSL